MKLKTHSIEWDDDTVVDLVAQAPMATMIACDSFDYCVTQMTAAATVYQFSPDHNLASLSAADFAALFDAGVLR